MAGQPKRRAKRERGEVASWRENPELSTRPPFEPGNTLSVRHGADSPRMVQPLADKFACVLPVVAPWTARPAFEGARASLCYVEAQLSLLRQYLDEHGLLDAEGKPRPAADRVDRLEARAGSLRSELGLTPQALAKLLGQLAAVASAGGDEDALDALKREGAAIVKSRQVVAVPNEDEGRS